MAEYKPRRASARWLDSDCPSEVLDIFDEGEKSACADRYTVFYKTPNGTIGIPVTFANAWIDYRAMSENPFHPQGIGLYCQMKAYEARAYRERRKHRRAKWSSLPEKVKQLVIQDCKQESI